MPAPAMGCTIQDITFSLRRLLCRPLLPKTNDFLLPRRLPMFLSVRVERAGLRSSKLRGDLRRVGEYFFQVEMIVKIGKRRFHIPAHRQPGIAADRFGLRPAELKVLGQEGFGFGEIAFWMESIEALNNCFRMH